MFTILSFVLAGLAPERNLGTKNQGLILFSNAILIIKLGIKTPAPHLLRGNSPAKNSWIKQLLFLIQFIEKNI